jgi:hypothetical protein
MTAIGRLLERLLMSLTGKRVDQFSAAATSIGDDDYFGISQDIGGGSYQTKKAKRKLLPNITMISRTSDLVRAAGVSGDDPELTFPVTSGVKYYLETRLSYSIVTPNGVLTWGWTVPALTTGNQDILYFQSGGFVWKRAHTGGPLLLSTLTDALSSFAVITDSLVLVPSADGTVSLNWSATANTVTLQSGSWLRVTKVTP